MQELDVIERSIGGQDWLTLLAFIWLTILAYVRMTYPLRFRQFTGSLFSEQYVNLYAREERWLFNNFNIPIGILFFMSLGFVTVRLGEFYGWFSRPNVLTFGMVSSLFMLFYLFRTAIVLFVGRLFRVESLVRYALLRRYSNAVLVGGVWFVGSLMSLYLPLGQRFVISLGLGLGGVLLLWGYVQIFRKLLKQTRLSFYYLILYICGLEIAPILLMAKWLSISV
jgi:hypothetical protein